jgi:ribosomal protein S18 acetylase RimI-like enzyme
MERKSYNLNDGREINLRPLQGKDREQLEQLFHSMSQNQNGWTDLQKIEKIDQKFEFPDYFINLVTEHNNSVIGFGEIQKDPQKKIGELNIHVHKDFQGVGLGTAIMIILLKEATEQKLHHIDLQVAAGNRRAIHLFMKFGFQVKQKTEEKSRVGEKDVIHMSKTLTTW